MPQKWKESIIVQIYNKGDQTSSAYKILSSILLARMIPCASEIIGIYQCDIILYIRRIL